MSYPNFYATYFSRTQPKRRSEQEMWNDHTEQLRSLAQSEFGEKCASRFKVPEVEEAEAAFDKALKEISDPDLRNEVDMAAGKIARAYQILGFCAGHFSQDSRASYL